MRQLLLAVLLLLLYVVLPSISLVSDRSEPHYARHSARTQERR